MLTILIWWLTMLLLGVGFLPLTHRIFRSFEDKGWIFSKLLGYFLSMWLLWVLNVAVGLPFTRISAVLLTLTLIAAIWVYYAAKKPELFVKELLPESQEAARLVIFEEAVFFGLMLLMMYLIGFRPEAYGTEKFMDYGFLTAMDRSTKIPFEDTWLSGTIINYYYGGQYAAAFLMKLTGTEPGLAYNAMRALVTACSFILPFSLVFQMMADKTAEGTGKLERQSGLPYRLPHRFTYAAGGLAGLAAAFCGNGHYLIYGIIKPAVGALTGNSYFYWYPDSTRFIGYDPDLPDKTIHEFPAYSSLLGDLHAHYINLIFVFLLLGILYAWANKRIGKCALPAVAREDRKQKHRRSGTSEKRKQAAYSDLRAFCGEIFGPEILMMGILTGIFRWTNAADFAIYYVVCGSVLFFVELYLNRKDLIRFAEILIAQALIIFAIGAVSALPFTMYFKEFTQGFGLTHSHTLWWQFLILWALPLAVLTGFVIALVKERGEFSVPDVTALLFGLCSAGLILLPELVYVKDIYGDEHYRANTMFKLTYQAFMMFAVMMAYVIIRTLLQQTVKKAECKLAFQRLTALAADSKSGEADGEGGPAAAAAPGNLRSAPGKLPEVLAAIAFSILFISAGYTLSSIQSWFGNVLDPSARISSSGDAYLDGEFVSDAAAIRWIRDNIEGTPVIAEAAGDSYSQYARVSVSTGLPTISGWYVHEWLWHNDFVMMNERRADLTMLYTSADEDVIRDIIKKYDVKYIYVGRLEREAYPGISETVLKDLGETVFDDGAGTYVIAVGA